MAITAAHKSLVGVLLIASSVGCLAAKADDSKTESVTLVATLPKTASSSDPVLQKAMDIINEAKAAQEKVNRRQNMKPGTTERVVKERPSRNTRVDHAMIMGGDAVMNSLPM